MYKLLIVDDDEDFLGLVSILLDAEEFQISTVKTGQEAMDSVLLDNYDAVILDVALPDFTGYFVGKTIRESHPKLPIAFLTNYNGDITKENAKDVEATFWFKPNLIDDSNKLSESVRSLIENEKKN